MRQIRLSLFVAAFLASLPIFVLYFFMSPKPIGAAGTMADAMCNPVFMQCPCMQIPNPKGGCMGGMNMHLCPCFDITSGFKTSGICTGPNKCLAQSSDGQGGMPMMPMLPMPMSMPMDMPMDCGSGFGGTSGIDPSRNSTTSTSTPQTCPNAYTPPSYNDPFSNNPSVDFTNPSIDFAPSSSSISDLIDTGGAGGQPTRFAVASSTGGNTTFVGGQVFGLTGGIAGDLKIFGTAVTAFVSNRDAANNAQVSGFYGQTAPTQAAAVQVVTTMCRLRPWSTNFLSFIVPASFFDSICTLRGFPVGQPAAKPVVKTTTTSSGTSAKPATQTPPPAPYVKPKVDVWAVPESVRSGFRTSVFWQASGVSSCAIVSADGLFNETGLSGHSASAPLTSATTFTMTCQTATSSPVVDKVTVDVI